MKTNKTAVRAAAGYTILAAIILVLAMIFHGKPDFWEFMIYDNVPFYRETPGDRLKEHIFEGREIV